jgi:2,4-dienoyl-CoA reductase-like NADH-dependent reductase (Old Yellow Enzyme family)
MTHRPDDVDAIPREVKPLFSPITVGKLELKTRLVYPPLTRWVLRSKLGI